LALRIIIAKSRKMEYIHVTYNKNHLERGGFYYFSFLNKIVSQE